MLPNTQTAAETVLVVSSSLNRTAALSGMLEVGPAPIAVLHAPDCEQASGYLQDSRISVVICEALLPDGSWKDLLDRITYTNGYPPLVVTARVADEYLWAEVLNLGGYDVLAQPFDADEVTRVVRSAVRASSDQARRPTQPTGIRLIARGQDQHSPARSRVYPPGENNRERREYSR